jgi:dGTPase
VSDIDPRDCRRHSKEDTDPRTPAQRDRDRLLYSSAFRRLANVTQVVAAEHGYVFHNRLTHALKVAQIGRRLAEQLTRNPDGSTLAERLGGLNPDVVEAAGLAHDLGHPPFGHLAEKVLNRLIIKENVLGGYEGNAQSFRIVTKLAIREEDVSGLDLTRATLNAILKYPWLRQAEGPKSRKWGAYQTEREDFEWARQGPKGDDRKSLEAEIMDYADDIAYSIYDLEDFYRAGKVPLERLQPGSDEGAEFLDEVFARWKAEKRPADNEKDYRDAFDSLTTSFPTRRFSGTRRERGEWRDVTSVLVTRYMEGIRLNDGGLNGERRVVISEGYRREMKMLQELIWHYVINNPNLATQQHGYRVVIEGLFNCLLAAIEQGNWVLFPPAVCELLHEKSRSEENVRIVADFIALLSEPQAVELYQRLNGISMGSFLKTIM